MEILGYFQPDQNDRNWFNLLVKYGMGYYKIIAVENLDGLTTILFNSNSVKKYNTREELKERLVYLEQASLHPDSPIFEDGKGNMDIDEISDGDLSGYEINQSLEY